MAEYKLFFYVNYIFGLIPLERSAKVTVKNKLSSLPTVLFMLTHIVSLVSIFWETRAQDNVSMAVNWIQFIPNTFAYLLWLTNVLQGRRCFQNIIFFLNAMDDKIKEVFGLSITNYAGRIRKYAVFATLAAILIGFSMSGLNFYLRVDLTKFYTFFYWLAFCLPKFCLMLVNFQFAGSVFLLSVRIKLLKDGLETHLRGKSYAIESKKKNLKKQVSVLSMMSSNLNAGQIASETSDIIESMQQCCSQICKFYGKQTILNLLSGFICITVQLYYLIVFARSPTEITDSAFVIATNCLLVVIHIVEFAALMVAGSHAKDRWSQVKWSLQTIRLNSIDKDVQGQIKVLLDCMGDRPMEFDAFDCFTIDLRLLTGAVSSITTYLVVLVQFQMAEDQGRNETDTGKREIKSFSAG